MLQADSILTCHVASIRNHDQHLLNGSDLELQMAFINIQDPATGNLMPAKLCVTTLSTAQTSTQHSTALSTQHSA
jgi:hypothetical protein